MPAKKKVPIPKNYNASFLACRGNSTHLHWKVQAIEVNGDIRTAIMVCQNCQTIRHKTINEKGSLIHGQQTYIHPKGYSFSGAQYDRDDFRLAWFKNLERELKQ